MRISILALLIPLAGLFAYGVSQAQRDERVLASPDGPRRLCREVALTRKPGWVLSGGWTSDTPPQLLLVDALNETIFRYSSSGASLGPIGEPLKSTLQNLLPVTGRPRGSEFIVEISDGLMLLDRTLRPVGTKGVLAASGRGLWSIGGLWQWEPVGEDVVAFTDILARGSNRKEIANWKSAFVRFPLRNPGDLTILRTVPLTSEDKTLFRSGLPYLAALGDTAYVLSLNTRLSLSKHERGSSQLEDVSDLVPGPHDSPRLPEFWSSDDYVRLMAAIEKESMPVGLYGWRNSLYILSRTPTGHGTRWFLTSIDPTRRNSSATVELPVRANHVTVIPGLQDWAFIEKGPVKGYGIQEISRALFIPSHLLQAPLKSDGMVCSR
jgi:hypothetical protein